MSKFSKRIAAVVVGVLLAVGGFAAAEYVLSSSGDATGVTATPSNPTVNGTINGALWPGDCNDVSVTFKNDNDHAVKITDVSGVIKTFLANTEHHGDTTYNLPGGNPGNAGQPGNNQGGNHYNLLKWQGDTNHGSFLGHVVDANDSYTFTIPNAVCLNPDANNSVQGKNIAATITVNSEVVAGNEYRG